MWKGWERWNGPASSSRPASEVKKPEQKKLRYTADMTPVPDSYRIKPGDLSSLETSGPIALVIELNRSPRQGLVIDTDGMVRISSKVGKIKLQGLSLDEAKLAIKEDQEVRNKPVFGFFINVSKADGQTLRDEESLSSYRITPGDTLLFGSKGASTEGLSKPWSSKVQPDGT